MIAIIDYGIGNISSIANMLKKAGVQSTITSSSAVIDQASKIILPGIGAFDHCMQQFNASGLRPIIEKKVVSNGTPLLGVCVGCQMLMERSEEGNEKGLGWIKGEVVKFKKDRLPEGYKIPHMSWTDVIPAANHPLYEGIVDPRFYFVHSYHIDGANGTSVTAVAEYGYSFAASVGKENIQGVQFHPEKSHRFGLQLYANFGNNI